MPRRPRVRLEGDGRARRVRRGVAANRGVTVTEPLKFADAPIVGARVPARTICMCSPVARVALPPLARVPQDTVEKTASAKPKPRTGFIDCSR